MSAKMVIQEPSCPRTPKSLTNTVRVHYFQILESSQRLTPIRYRWLNGDHSDIIQLSFLRLCPPEDHNPYPKEASGSERAEPALVPINYLLLL